MPPPVRQSEPNCHAEMERRFLVQPEVAGLIVDQVFEELLVLLADDGLELVHERFLALEIDAGALVADALTAIMRGEDRVTYLAFTNEKKPDGREGQPDHRIVRPLRRPVRDDAA